MTNEQFISIQQLRGAARMAAIKALSVEERNAYRQLFHAHCGAIKQPECKAYLIVERDIDPMWEQVFNRFSR